MRSSGAERSDTLDAFQSSNGMGRWHHQILGRTVRILEMVPTFTTEYDVYMTLNTLLAPQK